MCRCYEQILRIRLVYAFKRWLFEYHMLECSFKSPTRTVLTRVHEWTKDTSKYGTCLQLHFPEVLMYEIYSTHWLGILLDIINSSRYESITDTVP